MWPSLLGAGQLRERGAKGQGQQAGLYTFMLRTVRSNWQRERACRGLCLQQSHSEEPTWLWWVQTLGEVLVDPAVAFRCFLPLTEVAMLQVSQSPLIQYSTSHPHRS